MSTTTDATSGSRQKLIEATIELMSSRGFEAMGINSILEAAGVSKSNFYYHFKSKEDLCLAALDSMTDAFFSMSDPILLNKALSPRKRLEKFLKGMAEMIESECCNKGCPFVNLATETSDFVPAFRERISEYFDRYQQCFADVIQEGIQQGEFRSDVSAKLAAQVLLASMNGTIVLTKVHKRPQVMKENIKSFLAMMSAP
ncbi:MAG: TetR/AcrR family transcriptional regulator [Candidatus Obscuribacterales bacterium]|nr:TetR/AcrR family transcriptional regulator [Candidatus Obscuribacterales bacterium]